MEQLNPYFNCEAYNGNNSVYVLDDNGFKLFNSNQVELIKGHNVFFCFTEHEVSSQFFF